MLDFNSYDQLSISIPLPILIHVFLAEYKASLYLKTMTSDDAVVLTDATEWFCIFIAANY
jgi:hypothetical protein